MEIFLNCDKVLVVGHGPSYKDYDFIRKFEGDILSVDATTPDLLANGIVPNYTMYSETHKSVWFNLNKFLPVKPEDLYITKKMKIVHRTRCRPVLMLKAGRLKMECILFDGFPSPDSKYPTQAVGLYGICFADMRLKPKEIHLIGFDYIGLDNSGNDMTEEWIRLTKHYLDIRNSGIPITDHSGGAFPI